MEENKVTAEERLIGILNACSTKEYTDYKYLVDDDKIVVEQEIKRNIFYCSYDKIWSILESEYKMEDNDIKVLVNRILETHLKTEGYTTWRAPQEHILRD